MQAISGSAFRSNHCRSSNWLICRTSNTTPYFPSVQAIPARESRGQRAEGSGTQMKTDVIIIGGGLHGCSTALHLAQRGFKPVVLEKNVVGRHASGVNAGGVRQLMRDVAEIPLSV